MDMMREFLQDERGTGDAHAKPMEEPRPKCPYPAQRRTWHRQHHRGVSERKVKGAEDKL